MPLRHAAPSPSQLHVSLHWLAKEQSRQYPFSHLDTLVKTGNETIDATLSRRSILFAEFVARVEDTKVLRCVMFGEVVGGVGCVAGQDKKCIGSFLGDLRVFGISANLWTTAAQNKGE